ncbi:MULTISPECIES: AzlD domain-containing protein [unclassified Brevibacterium]|uniref:AzlD domain-containing protein n=1 Tax=unclassified Brevibacterium TaxID=2614124 RepID=UPI0010F7EE70|nr:MULTISPECIES: AzlD domain-containing protein [unclassified Brevibacterium]MCM1011420.1 AzlD domain-containing protein [Brevibacterium sp. XM4083]
MTATSFLIALAALAIGTYVMRFAGVKVGAALATRGKRRALVAADDDRAPASASTATPSATTPANDPAATGADVVPDEPTSRVTKWMDRATVVLIGAVFATTAIFDGRDLADPARLIGVGVGVLAAILRVPMLVSVVLAMGVCAGLRVSGIL